MCQRPFIAGLQVPQLLRRSRLRRPWSPRRSLPRTPLPRSSSLLRRPRLLMRSRLRRLRSPRGSLLRRPRLPRSSVLRRPRSPRRSLLRRPLPTSQFVFSRNSNHLLYFTYCVPWLWPEYSFPLHQLWRASCKHRIVCASFILGFHVVGPRKRWFASACAHKLAYVCRASGQNVTFPFAVTGSALIADLHVQLFAAVLF